MRKSSTLGLAQRKSEYLLKGGNKSDLKGWKSVRESAWTEPWVIHLVEFTEPPGSSAEKSRGMRSRKMSIILATRSLKI